MKNYLINIYNYREMLKNLVKKDLRTRYKGSFLGFLWTFINPLLQLLVYTVVFSTILRINIDNFPMFLFVGILPWIFFSTSLLVSSTIILANKDLIKKIYFPREVLPTSVAISGLINMLLGFMVVVPFLYILDLGLTSLIIYLPIIFITQFVLILGLNFLLSAVTVFFRDIEHILSIIMMAWFYFTPIVFPVEMIPEEYLFLFFLNPMTPIVLAFRDVLFFHVKPDLIILMNSLLISFLVFVLGYYVFQRLEREFAEEM